jgi:hypothetical protein
VGLGQVLLWVLKFLPVSIVPPMSILVYCWHYVISVIDSVIKQHLKKFLIFNFEWKI